MLDALMGRGRNLEPGAEFKAPSWEDEGVCRYYLVNFCPHDLFTNTKADLGACADAHDPDIKEAYTQAKPSRKKEDFEDGFLRFSQRLLSDVAMKIKRSKERLLLDQREQLAANGISPAQQEEIEMKVSNWILNSDSSYLLLGGDPDGEDQRVGGQGRGGGQPGRCRRGAGNPQAL